MLPNFAPSSTSAVRYLINIQYFHLHGNSPLRVSSTAEPVQEQVAAVPGLETENFSEPFPRHQPSSRAGLPYSVIL